MAPVKFGLFKARSREQQEQPSTENLLQTSNSVDLVQTPGSPVPSASKAQDELEPDVMSMLHLNSEDEIDSGPGTPRRGGSESRLDDVQVNYRLLKNQSSIDATSTSTLHDDDDFDYIHHQDLDGETLAVDNTDGASTSCDANSLQFDETSITPSEDLSVYCGTLKKPKKMRSRELREKQLRDFDMWQASNIEVMQNLLSKSGTMDDQIKWQAIATSRGLCTLTDSCTCGDCRRTKYLAGIADGDGGLGAAPLFSGITVGCNIQ